ncbi:hypothetical protein A3F64_01725 [Candidatus Saccharibacteria bacterium RIFCSPHIGHO2_12_FULL_42_8]|nr:MAG: hypothetical protein A3F64_01725 [Candidatus Saccharibacteria bacterium RIFCSPHIGHO2_12_FULL_42_8]
MIGDFGKDLDDENALLYAVGAHKAGKINLTAVVANLSPALLRARIARGILEYLGIDIPVGLGTSCNVRDDTQEYEANIPYLSKKTDFEDGQKLIKDVLEKADDESVVLILNSGLTDAAELMEDAPLLCKRKLSRVAIMGGVVCEKGQVKLNAKGHMIPDDAANNSFDPKSAKFVYEWLQSQNIPMSILTRNAAYACKFDIGFYESLARANDTIGRGIRDRQRPATEHLWKAANAPTGSETRGTLPDRCTRKWFVDAYLDGADPGNVESIWDPTLKIGTFQYDPLNVASVVRPELFAPTKITVNGAEHQVIGLAPSEAGIADTDLLRKDISDNIIDALKITST